MQNAAAVPLQNASSHALPSASPAAARPAPPSSAPPDPRSALREARATLQAQIDATGSPRRDARLSIGAAAPAFAVSPRGAAADAAPLPSGSGLHGTLDHQMATIHAQFRTLFQQEVAPEVYARAQPVLSLLADPGATFAQRRQAVDAFVGHYKTHDPQAIADLVKMIDCQLLVYGMAENQERLAGANPSADLRQSVQRLTRASGNDATAVAERLADMTIAPVLTAHPTSLHDPQTITELHDAFDDVAHPQALQDACADLWRGGGPRRERPGVQTEARNNLPHLQRMQHEIRRIHKEIDRTVTHAAGLARNPSPIAPLLRPESWIGGDRDGNTKVDAATMKSIVALQAGAAISRYRSKLGDQRADRPGSLRQLLDTHFPGEAAGIVRRLGATRTLMSGETDPDVGHADDWLAYRKPQELLAHLNGLQARLPAEARPKLGRFIREVEGAGFHGAAIDVRQNSAAHETTVAELLAEAGIEADYANLREEDKQALLWGQLTAPDKKPLQQAGKHYSGQTAKEMHLFHAIGDIHAKYGREAMPNYIVANTETVSDLLEPMLLLKEAGLAGPKGLKMKMIPLIETVPDLKQGREIVGKLLEHPQYRAWLAAGDNTQQVMVGYSDSNRLDGPLSSNWEIEKALHYLQDVTAEHGVKLLVFHGRGGTVARGAGADPQQEVAMMPDGAGRNGYRFTDQGEKIAHKYGNANAAEHHLRGTTAAALDATLPRNPPENPAYHAVIESMSTRASQAYRDLIFGNPKTIDFFNDATPVCYTPHLNAGSRAASRNNLGSQRVNVGQLRAIPWVAGWTQQRSMLPTYLGFGTAASEAVRSAPDQAPDPAKLGQLQGMYREWPFFQHFIDRTEGELAKVSLPIVEQYATLAESPETGRAIYDEIAAEYGRAKEMVLAIKQQDHLLQNDPVQQSNLARRAPVLDTANALQISLIDAQRTATDDALKDQLLQGVVGSMQAVRSGIGRFG